jgi:uncharacterized cupredoxin-like copper-binding protein
MHTFKPNNALMRGSALVAVAAAVFLVSGCGGGAGQVAGPTKSTGSPASTGVVLNLTATEYSFAPSTPTVAAGKTTIRLTDKGAEGHDFTIDALHVHITTEPGKTAQATVVLKPGTYTFYCSVPGHLQSGMHGKLAVS